MNEKKLFLGFNWKTNPATLDDTLDLFSTYKEICEDLDKTEVAVFPPSVFTGVIADFNEDFEVNVAIGSQDVSGEGEGAFTGECSASMLKSLGLEYCITGHSETRTIQKLTNQEVRNKNLKCLENEIVPVFCIGFQKDPENTEINYKELTEQVLEGLEGLGEKIKENGLILAYEPVWAIGSGKTADLETVEKVLAFLRELLEKEFGADIADQIRILYGGSVSGSNSKELSECKNLDGFLIGGASLSKEKFEPLIESLK